MAKSRKPSKQTARKGAGRRIAEDDLKQVSGGATVAGGTVGPHKAWVVKATHKLI